ncbi:hypothetical protein ALP91_00983 [Pseudomonas savastanoi pv. glycinea]|nr:hypothetical protein ALP91_00983 [Pseudomonas savastanoi pv. glycinea]RMU61129.1 hypothetical protein ALP25_200109 [Pseudomonas syringae pv. syringae]
MRHSRRDIKEVAFFHDGMLFQRLAIPAAGGFTQGIDGGFMLLMFVSLAPASRGNCQQLHMDMSGTCTLCGDADLIIHTLLALRGFGGFQKDTIKLITGHGFLLA